MYFIGVYKYTKTHGYDPEIPRNCIRFSCGYLIVRKIGISCEVVMCLFFPFLRYFYAHPIKRIIHLSSVIISFSF